MGRIRHAIFYVVVIFLSLVADMILAYQDYAEVRYQKIDARQQDQNRNSQNHSRKFDKVKILTRHKRIKKSASHSQLQLPDSLPGQRHFVIGPNPSNLKAIKYGIGENKFASKTLKMLPGDKQMTYHAVQKSTNKRRPMTLTHDDPYIPSAVKTSTSARKSKNNLKLKLIKNHRQQNGKKKFKRSLQYGDLAKTIGRRVDEAPMNGQKQQRSRYYSTMKNSRKKKMQKSDRYYSLAEAKNELDRRRKMIRNLKKKMGKNRQLFKGRKYIKKPTFGYRNYLSRPTVESFRKNGLSTMKYDIQHSRFTSMARSQLVPKPPRQLQKFSADVGHIKWEKKQNETKMMP